ncbi:MAG: hypothetical protein LBG20_04485 [Holosporaceae bacterium]|jgi:hypothetical protein|nr:hypothetical protein [Holosporaceae bacterium]
MRPLLQALVNDEILISGDKGVLDAFKEKHSMLPHCSGVYRNSTGRIYVAEEGLISALPVAFHECGHKVGALLKSGDIGETFSTLFETMAVIVMLELRICSKGSMFLYYEKILTAVLADMAIVIVNDRISRKEDPRFAARRPGIFNRLFLCRGERKYERSVVRGTRKVPASRTDRAT